MVRMSVADRRPAIEAREGGLSKLSMHRPLFPNQEKRPFPPNVGTYIRGVVVTQAQRLSLAIVAWGRRR